MMRVHFLGVAGAGGPPSFARSCFLVETGDSTLLLDIGEGCGWRLVELGLSLCDIDYIFISHGHFDHYSGLFDATVRAAITGCRKARLLVHKSVREELFLPRLRSVELIVDTIGDEWVRVGEETRLKAVESCHTVPTYGAIVEYRGASLYYTSDTKLCSSIVENVRGKSLVLAEATIPNGLEEVAMEHRHMTVQQAVSLTRYMDPGSLLALVHRSVESERQVRRAGLAPRVLVPSDFTSITL